MSLDRVKQKLQEAESFFAKMQEHERDRFRPTENFEFGLSAFLNAGYSVEETLVKFAFNRFPANERAKCNKWLARWEEDTLTSEEKHLIEIMKVSRRKEVHNEGSRHKVKVEKRPFVGTHLDHSTGAFVHMSAPHGVSLGD
jgi:hypothetical protein